MNTRLLARTAGVLGIMALLFAFGCMLGTDGPQDQKLRDVGVCLVLGLFLIWLRFRLLRNEAKQEKEKSEPPAGGDDQDS